MSGKSIGFIGGGRITRVFLGGWAKAGKVPSTVVVSDTDAGVLASLKQSYGDCRNRGKRQCPSSGSRRCVCGSASARDSRVERWVK